MIFFKILSTNIYPEKIKNIKADAYDLVCNGYELGGGSLRIYNSEVQTQMFNLLGFTDEERDNLLRRLESENKTKIDIQRYKGLGEMNAEQLWETTMNAETRTLIQVTVDHIMEEETNVRFRELMGSEVEHRRKFITERAKFATNIDI